MFDFGLSASELLTVGLVALIVMGPKDLPKLLRTIGRFVNQLRSMAGEFQMQLNAAASEAGMDELKKEVKAMTNFTVTNDIGNEISKEFHEQGKDIKKPLEEKSAAAAPKSDDPVSEEKAPAIEERARHHE